MHLCNDSRLALFSNESKSMLPVESKPMNKARVLVADDHEEVRRMVARLLSPKFEIAGSVADGQQLVSITARRLHRSEARRFNHRADPAEQTR